MKVFLLSTIVVVLLVAPVSGQASRRSQRAWKPFFTAFEAAVKQRDRNALMKMMPPDFYYLSSGGDENGNQDSRDEAFEYWQTTGDSSWQTLEKIIAEGTVPNTVLREPTNTWPSRVAPPLAADRKAVADRKFEWYAVFEFRNGRWYWVAFTECCE